MSVKFESQKANFAIFLDIDGVLNPNDISCKKIDQYISSQLDGELIHTKKCESCNLCKQAQAHFFTPSAVACLEDLIEKIQKVAGIHIVISSTWRKNSTTEELKTIFGEYNFSNFIVDKTPEKPAPFSSWKGFCQAEHFDLKDIEKIPQEIKEKLIALKDEPEKKREYAKTIVDRAMRCRASEINEWRNSHPKYAGFLVIDDHDEEAHLSLNFKDQFIFTPFLLNEGNVQKGYEEAIRQITFEDTSEIDEED